jgi:hypothetical protein
MQKSIILFVAKRGQGVNKFTLICLEFGINFLNESQIMNPENFIQKKYNFRSGKRFQKKPY